MAQELKALRVLVLGGAGSIGSTVCKALADDGAIVTALDRCEENIWRLETERSDIKTVICDASDLVDMLHHAVAADRVVNCAGLKHVDLCARNPKEAVRCNVVPARILALHRIRSVYVSTDKAIEPISEMGCTKAVGEKLTIQAGGIIVRLGNVLGSRGSLIPSVIRAGRLNRPVRMTDPQMTRFFMTINEAVAQIVAAIRISDTPLPIALRSARIGDFIRVSQQKYAPHCEIEEIGPREEEKLHELMMWGGEPVSSDDARFLMSEDAIHSLLDALPEPELML